MNIYKQAIEKWGYESQINMMIEECAELIVALRHLDRGKATELDVCSEIADVEILCNQMRVIFGNEKVDSQKEIKLERVKKRLNKKE